MGCENKISIYVERGWTHKEVKLRCGSTDPHGDTVICDDCQKKARLAYPQGWLHVPGDKCKHGTYIGNANGPDYMCGICEGE